MDLYSSSERNGLELFVYVVQDLVVYFKCLEDLLVRILKGNAGEVGSDLAPACVRAAPVRRSQEDDELCPTADHLRSTDGLSKHISKVLVVLCIARQALTSFRMMPPRLCTTNASGFCTVVSLSPWATSPDRLVHTPLSISRSSRTDRSRPCCEMLFLLLAWKSPPITSALYPYVHTRACGMSTARYSLGQKMAGDGVELEGPCACSAAKDGPARRLNRELSPLDFFVTSVESAAAVSQVF